MPAIFIDTGERTVAIPDDYVEIHVDASEVPDTDEMFDGTQDVEMFQG